MTALISVSSNEELRHVYNAVSRAGPIINLESSAETLDDSHQEKSCGLFLARLARANVVSSKCHTALTLSLDSARNLRQRLIRLLHSCRHVHCLFEPLACCWAFVLSDLKAIFSPWWAKRLAYPLRPFRTWNMRDEDLILRIWWKQFIFVLFSSFSPYLSLAASQVLFLGDNPMRSSLWYSTASVPSCTGVHSRTSSAQNLTGNCWPL